MSKRILVVGHCNMDGPRLVRELTAALPEADVERINSNADLRAACEAGPSLLLVNRVPVGFDEQGLDLIKDLHGRYPECTTMLVSDRPEAQDAALKAGAVPGFGKKEFGSPRLVKVVEAALAG